MRNSSRINPKHGTDQGVRAKAAAAETSVSPQVRESDPGFGAPADTRVPAPRRGIQRIFSGNHSDIP